MHVAHAAVVHGAEDMDGTLMGLGKNEWQVALKATFLLAIAVMGIFYINQFYPLTENQVKMLMGGGIAVFTGYVIFWGAKEQVMWARAAAFLIFLAGMLLIMWVAEVFA